MDSSNSVIKQAQKKCRKKITKRKWKTRPLSSEEREKLIKTYVLYNFEWEKVEAAFSPIPLSFLKNTFTKLVELGLGRIIFSLQGTEFSGLINNLDENQISLIFKEFYNQDEANKEEGLEGLFDALRTAVLTSIIKYEQAISEELQTIYSMVCVLIIKNFKDYKEHKTNLHNPTENQSKFIQNLLETYISTWKLTKTFNSNPLNIFNDVSLNVSRQKLDKITQSYNSLLFALSSVPDRVFYKNLFWQLQDMIYFCQHRIQVARAEGTYLDIDSLFNISDSEV